MSIAESSVVFRLCSALWKFLICAWHNSVVGRLLDRIEKRVRGWAAQSRICRVLARDGWLLRAWPDSKACHALTWIVNLPAVLTRWIYKLNPAFWEGSRVFRAVAAIGSKAWIALGALMLIMLCVPHAKWNNVYGLIGAILVTVLFFVGCMRRAEQRIRVDVLGPYTVAYMGLILCAFIFSLSLRYSLRFVLFHLTCFLIVLVVVSSIERYEQLQKMLVIVGVGLFAAAVFGCYQSYVGVAVVPGFQDAVLNAGMPGRVYSFFDNPNNFAEIIVMLTPLVLALLFNARTYRGKFLALVVIGAAVVAIGATYSRSGWIGLVGAVVLFFAFRNWRLVPVLTVVVIAAIPFMPQTIYNRILTIGDMRDSSTLYRISILKSTATLLKDFWLRGVGLGSDVMRKVFETYPPMHDGRFPIHTHNNYLQVWGEVGIFGLLAYLATLFGHLKAGVKAYVSSTDRRLKTMLAASISAMCGIMVISFAEYTWFYPRNMFLFWFLFAVIAVCVKIARTPEETK